MTSQLVIGVDSSTTATKALAWDRRGRIEAQARTILPTLKPHPGWYEQDAELWWSSLCTTLREVAERVSSARIEALCITNQRETIVPVGADGKPLRPAILWLDGRCRRQLEVLERKIGGDRLRRITGKPLSMVPSVAKLLWIAEEESELFRRSHRFLEAHALLVQRLTGEYRTSLACADPVGLVDMEGRCWAAGLVHELGFREDQFPELYPPGEILGRLAPAAAKQTGLPEGLPVVAGAGDGQCAGLGVNVTAPGPAYLIMGTGVIGGLFSPEYRTDPAFRTLYSPIPGSYYLETVTKAGVFTVAWFVEKFAAELDKPWLPLSAEALLEQGARQVPPGSEGLLLVPYWLGSMTPYWDADASGIMIGWSGSHGPEHFYRAILEGIAFEQRLACESLASAGLPQIRELRIVGGGSRSELWCQIVADVTGIPVTASASVEASALGAGILAAAAVGWYPDARSAARAMTELGKRFEPDPVAQGVYGRLYNDVYKPLFPAVRPLVDRLSALSGISDSIPGDIPDRSHIPPLRKSARAAFRRQGRPRRSP
jgi:sugar (pentulose or hexulose) kinase